MEAKRCVGERIVSELRGNKPHVYPLSKEQQNEDIVDLGVMIDDVGDDIFWLR